MGLYLVNIISKVFIILLCRSLIALELTDKMPLLILMLNEEMDDCQETLKIYRRKMRTQGKSASIKNMPVMSSQLKFIHELRKKIRTNIQHFVNLDHPICSSSDSQLLLSKYQEFKAELARYAEEIYGSWVSEAEKTTMQGVQIPLLVRETGILRVNFDRNTMAILMDVRYITREFQSIKVPQSVMDIYEHFDHFKNVQNTLDSLTDLYNYLKTNTTDIEFQLIQEEVAEVDLILKPAESSLHWMSPDITSFSHNLLVVVSEINARVKEAQDNVIRIYREISRWEKTPLFSRIKCSETNLLPLDLEGKEEKKEERYTALRSAAQTIHQLIQENRKIFDIDPQSKVSEKRWKNYLVYVDTIVMDSIIQTVFTRKHLTFSHTHWVGGCWYVKLGAKMERTLSKCVLIRITA